LYLTKPFFDAAKITVPTLVIRGDSDTDATRADNQLLMSALGSAVKEYVEIPNGGHFLQFEKSNIQLYQAIHTFLETKEVGRR
jgi:pimeloyl-ACP methyl ester carboxylesterase